MHALRMFRTTIAALALALAPSVALGQGDEGVARSGMGQGEARISSRSDVRLSMESMPGTSGATMSTLGTRVGAQMRTIRGCYETTVEEDPSVTGTLRLRLLLPERGRPDVEIDRDGVGDATLVGCVTRALGGIDAAGIDRPSGAVVQLEMGNSSAEGAERARTRAQQAQQVQVTIDGDGNATSSGGAPDRGVRFTVVGQGRESAPAVVAAHRALSTALPGLLDCHRRSGRRGHSAEGEIRATMAVRDGRPPQSRVTRCGLTHPRARGCLNRVLRGIERRSDGGTGRVEIQLHFAEPAPIEGR